MKCLEKGHIYEVANRAVPGKPNDPPQKIVFINLQPGQEHAGATTQEMLRVLIDRTRHCANCMPHPNNERIVYHLRMALALHETRAIERRIEKEGLEVEFLPVDDHGHLSMGFVHPEASKVPCTGELTPTIDPHPLDGAKVPKHPVAHAE